MGLVQEHKVQRLPDQIDSRPGAMNNRRVVMANHAAAAHRPVITAIIFILLLMAVVQGLYFNFAQDAPLRSSGKPPAALTAVETLLAHSDAVFTQAASEGDVLYHVERSAKPSRDEKLLATEIFYAANHALFPHRAVVGRGDAVINQPDDLLRADVIPNVKWLKAHDIHAVISLDLQAGQLRVIPLPGQ